MQKLDSKTIRLTETVQKGGCAAKLPAGQLREILGNIGIKKPQSLLVGTENLDDACIWDLGNGQSLVQTLDFFTPIVDDAYDFGAIAATNALSDVYAMGGSPKIALSILAFPAQTLPIELCQPLLKGALEKIHEAGACLAGGHTIDDDTLKFGLSVTGFVETKNVWTNAGAKINDVLILTKALGTGTITTALKCREVEPESVKEAIESMKQLNAVPELLQGEIIHAATDITGFGLAGHSLQMARASGVCFEISTAQVPVLHGALKLLETEYLNRAHKTNLEYVKDEIKNFGISDSMRWLMVDPQTSGGLLLAVPPDRSETIVKKLREKFLKTSIIGRVIGETGNNRLHLLK